jgi:hypothetical protein
MAQHGALKPVSSGVMNYGATTELRKIAPVSFSYGATRLSPCPATASRG